MSQSARAPVRPPGGQSPEHVSEGGVLGADTGDVVVVQAREPDDQQGLIRIGGSIGHNGLAISCWVLGGVLTIAAADDVPRGMGSCAGLRRGARERRLTGRHPCRAWAVQSAAVRAAHAPRASAWLKCPAVLG